MDRLFKKIILFPIMLLLALFPLAPYGKAFADDISFPSVILEGYAIRGNLAAGEDFVLEYTLRNTSSSTYVTNIVITVNDGAGVFYPSYGKSNQGYVPLIARGATATGEIPLSVNKTAADGIHDLTFTMNYQGEAVDGEMLELDGYISLEVSGNPLETVDVSLPETCEAGAASLLRVSYINNGAQALRGVSLLVEGNISGEAVELPVGDVQPGMVGIAEGEIIFLEPGEQALSVMPAYEDAGGQLISYQPVTVETTVVEAEIPPPGRPAAAGSSGLSGLIGRAERIPAPVILAGVILCVAALGTMVFLGRRKR